MMSTVSSALQSSLVPPPVAPPGSANGNGNASFLPILRRSLFVKTTVPSFRCQASKEDPEAEQASSLPSNPPPKPASSSKVWDLMAFSGPAPERINGRLAMVGFVSALGVELAKGDDVIAQIMNGGLPWFVGTTVLLSLASLVPLVRGESMPKSSSQSIMSPDAEMWNGRFAMLGLVALVFTEFVTGKALI